MKKIVLLSFVFLCSTLTLAATTPETTTVIQPPITVNADTTMEGVAKNIDRRLVYFNRYKNDGDMESLAKLVSEENKDFYINFMKYVKLSPAFTLKRDTAEKIIKTPIGGYVISAIMSVNKKEIKVSISFTEEQALQGTKWLISDSNLHIQTPLATTNTTTKENNLASNALENNTPKTTTPETDTKAKEETGMIQSKPIVTVPVIDKKPGDTPKVTTPLKSESGGIGIITISIIAIAATLSILLGVFWILMLIDCVRRNFEKKTLWLLLLIFLGTPASIAYYFIVKGKDKQKTSPAITATTAANIVSPSSEPSAPMTITTVEEIKTEIIPPINSNVSISTVEDIQKKEALISEQETTITPVTPEPPANIAETPMNPSTASIPQVIEDTQPIASDSPTITEETVSPTTPESHELSPVSTEIPENPVLDIPDTPIVTTQETSQNVPTEEIVPISEQQIEAPKELMIEAPIAAQEAIDASQKKTEIKSIEQIMEDSAKNVADEEMRLTKSSSPLEPAHSLFESILNPTPPKPEIHGLFENILTPEN